MPRPRPAVDVGPKLNALPGTMLLDVFSEMAGGCNERKIWNSRVNSIYTRSDRGISEGGVSLPVAVEVVLVEAWAQRRAHFSSCAYALVLFQPVRLVQASLADAADSAAAHSDVATHSAVDCNCTPMSVF